MDAPGGPAGASWLEHSIGPGVSRNFKIKPGTYKVSVGCGTNFHGTMTVNFTIAGTLEVALAGSRRTEPGALIVPVSGRVGRFIPPRAPVQQQYAEPEPADEPAAAEEPSAPASPAASAPAPRGKPSGATCDQSYQCASNACITHSPNNYCR